MTDRVERRRHGRHERPTLLVTLEGHTYRATNWSLGGVLLTGYDGSRGIGEAVTGQLGMAGTPERHSFVGLVVRVDHENRDMALGFAGLSDGAFNLLQSHAVTRGESG